VAVESGAEDQVERSASAARSRRNWVCGVSIIVTRPSISGRVGDCGLAPVVGVTVKHLSCQHGLVPADFVAGPGLGHLRMQWHQNGAPPSVFTDPDLAR
jgi:hypothetical protein